ncbi:DoxX family protein [Mesorhizobium neociceri]|uniref:DoxX family protein n=1 Tax=Mesorhizobium neociceri TaxID=1307853 RepID=A0A838AXT9_9HYPH|nr:DoxX family protein [Mesorhizobium neociceri]MBA1138641.1 DoxX family protein [Mesorhizobium neociceri]
MNTKAIQAVEQSFIGRLLTAPALRILALLALCAAYIQGPIVKLLDFGGAVAEMEHFGLSPAPFFAAAVIVFEFAMSALILTGYWRWIGALALAAFTLAATWIALRFWELPPGPQQSMAMNAFFEHVGLAGAFVFVAANDLANRRNSRPAQYRSFGRAAAPDIQKG